MKEILAATTDAISFQSASFLKTLPALNTLENKYA